MSKVKIKYYLYRGIFGAFARLPLPVLYLISDLLRFVFKNILHYRIKVVRANLKAAFPEKNEAELKAIEDDFYIQLCDNMVETLKLLHISPKTIRKRISISGGEYMTGPAMEGKPVVVMAGHYANWEWIPAAHQIYKVPNIMGVVYKPVRDEAFDLLMQKIRNRAGGHPIPQKQALRELLTMWRELGGFAAGFVADQRPNSSINQHYQLQFLGQETNISVGPERIGNKMGASYVYVRITKPRRGYYHFEYVPIAPEKDGPEYSVLHQYYALLEETIRQRPGLWLWSHRRWLNF